MLSIFAPIVGDPTIDHPQRLWACGARPAHLRFFAKAGSDLTSPAFGPECGDLIVVANVCW
jgi:hypothetical protein